MAALKAVLWNWSYVGLRVLALSVLVRMSSDGLPAIGMLNELVDRCIPAPKPFVAVAPIEVVIMVVLVPCIPFMSQPWFL